MKCKARPANTLGNTDIIIVITGRKNATTLADKHIRSNDTEQNHLEKQRYWFTTSNGAQSVDIFL